jgi:hypothetical protein
MSLGVVSLLLLASVQAQPGASPAPPAVTPPRQTADASLPAKSSIMGPDIDLSGTWKGTTSQGREIEFHVEGNTLKILRVAWQIGFEKACIPPDERLPMQTRQGVQVMRYQSPEAMTAGHLKTRLGIGSDLDLAVTGTLAPDGSANGDFDLATVGDTRCSGKVKATWKASRQ